MNSVLAVPNWSIYDPELIDRVAKEIPGCFIHYAQGDVDHARTVIAFSGSQEAVFDAMFVLANELLPHIDLSQSHGVHPASGALDVAPFVLLSGDEQVLIEQCRDFAIQIGDSFDVPVHLYEQAALPGAETLLPVLRGQTRKPVPEPFIPRPRHPKWGQIITGVRDFLVAANINLETSNLALGKAIAAEIRKLRETGHPDFIGVRALAFPLASRNLVQLSFNFTRPDDSSFDRVYDFVISKDVEILDTELIGVIRDVDLEKSTRLVISPSQVVQSAKL